MNGTLPVTVAIDRVSWALRAGRGLAVEELVVLFRHRPVVHVVPRGDDERGPHGLVPDDVVGRPEADEAGDRVVAGTTGAERRHIVAVVDVYLAVGCRGVRRVAAAGGGEGAGGDARRSDAVAGEPVVARAGGEAGEGAGEERIGGADPRDAGRFGERRRDLQAVDGGRRDGAGGGATDATGRARINVRRSARNSGVLLEGHRHRGGGVAGDREVGIDDRRACGSCHKQCRGHQGSDDYQAGEPVCEDSTHGETSVLSGG